MRCVDANTERKFWAPIHYRAQMLEAMTDAFTLPRGVLQQNAKPSESQSFTSSVQTTSAGFDPIRLASATRAAGMDDEIIDAQKDRPLGFLSKRRDRFHQQ